MNKDNLLFGIAGLLIGCIIGFFFANKTNKNIAPAPNAESAQSASANPNMSSIDHATNSANGAKAGDASPEIAETIKKAKDEPNNFDAQMRAAALYREINRNEQALELYEKANKLKPDDYQALVWLGNVNFELERYEKAESWYTAALAKKPDDVSVRTELGSTFLARKQPDLDRAIKEFQVSLQHDPNHRITLHNITYAYIEKRDAQKAKEYLDKLEKLEPANEEVSALKKRLENIQSKT